MKFLVCFALIFCYIALSSSQNLQPSNAITSEKFLIIFNESRNWADATQGCKSKYSNLIQIDSEKERDEVLKAIKSEVNFKKDDDAVWILGVWSEENTTTNKPEKENSCWKLQANGQTKKTNCDELYPFVCGEKLDGLFDTLEKDVKQLNSQ
uniref:Putative c-type lectin n=1 Tax=Lutzomyia longipalpis TaxID=7200 RepID=A0A7G3AA48_LUTLO